MKDKKETRCEMCEIILDVPSTFRIFQYAPMRFHKLLIILTNDRETISYMTGYSESSKYIFRRKSDNAVILTHNMEFYGC